eukprot:12410642-Heterocapsa_arctica.AAC.1
MRNRSIVATEAVKRTSRALQLVSEEPRRARSQSSWKRSNRSVGRLSCICGADARQVNRRVGG